MLKTVEESRGFTLIELSVVLVVIGLIVGGVLMGRDLLHAAAMRNIISEYEKLHTSIITFREKYKSMPGDMRGATALWGTDPDGCPGHNVQTPKTETCDGNGDRLILYGPEGFRFWQHLANAGLLTGIYSGVGGPANASWDAEVGLNVPRSKYRDDVGFSAVSIVYSNSAIFPAIAGSFGPASKYEVNQIFMGVPTGVYWTYGSFLKPVDLWQIDSKIDNGMPGTGIIVAANYRTCTDTNDELVAASNAANYDLNYDDIGCAILFMPNGTSLER